MKTFAALALMIPLLLTACAAPPEVTAIPPRDRPNADEDPDFACAWFILTRMPRDADLLPAFCPPEATDGRGDD